MKENMKNLVQKYINGEEIPESVLKDLEKDKKFMMEVIKVSKDKNIYNLCADGLKKDNEFIKYLILTFKDDINFIMMVANNYLNTNPSKEEVIELCIIMNNIIGYPVDSKFYRKKLQENINVKQQVITLKKKENISIPSLFWQNKDKYFNNKIIMDYYAKTFLYEYYTRYYTYLKKTFNLEYTIKDNLTNEEIIKVLLNFIRTVDDGLASYLTLNQELLDWYLHDVKRNRLQMQVQANNMEAAMYEQVNDLCFNKVKDSGILWENIMYYVFKETGIIDAITERGYIDFGMQKESEIVLEQDEDVDMKQYLEELNQEMVEAKEDGLVNPYKPMPEKDFYDYLNSHDKDLNLFEETKKTVNKLLKKSARKLKKKITNC